MGDQMRIRVALDRFAQSSKLLMLLDERGRERLSACAAVVGEPAGAVVVRQGEIGDAFYLIAAGELRVLVGEGRGHEPREVARLGAGQFFGEMAVLTRQPRSATVVAVSATELVRFERDPVLAVLNDYPAVREIIGSVGLQRSEANLESRATAPQPRAGAGTKPEPLGLSELLEGEDEPLDERELGEEEEEEP
jgi:CRP-like cAMP-binding protein